MCFTPLNLPLAELKLIRSEGITMVRCLIREKNVVLTPEEWVRQHLLNYLYLYAGYQKGKIAVEYALKYNSSIKRCDIVVFNDAGQPQVIVECKAPDVKIKKETFYQAAKYDFALNAKCIMVSNGIVHFSLLKSSEGNNMSFLEGIISKDDLLLT